MSGKIHIVLGFDERFWAPAYATMRSVCISSRRRGDIVFHLLTTQISPLFRLGFQAISRDFGALLVDYRLDEDEAVAERLKDLPATKDFPSVVFARLLLDRLLPPEVEKLVYLDCDVYVRAPIEELLAIDLAGKPIGAVSEPGRHHLIGGDDLSTRVSPFDTADPYFNSGVLLIDRAGWAAADLPGLLERLKASGELKKLYHDQDVLNLAFKDNWLKLDWRWNVTKPHPALRALDPYIVHYTTGQKPWNALAYVAFGSSYKHVMTRAVVRQYRAYRRRLWLQRLIGNSKHKRL